VISAINAEGIVISAKIDLGNSGGLAVDDKGCFLGVPTLVTYGDSESYGIIIPAADVYEFIDKLLSLYEEES
jgi:S1-C subfamily serine protease